jgi:hypothetical protein
MQIVTHNLLHYGIEDGTLQIANILYEDSSFAKAIIEKEEKFSILQISTGTWVFQFTENDVEKIMYTIRTQPAGSMVITTFYHRKKYQLKRSQNHKLRFSLFNLKNEELLSILPVIDWQKSLPQLTLQLNEEFDKECDVFLILQSLHCTLCSMSMMLGGNVSALISI